MTNLKSFSFSYDCKIYEITSDNSLPILRSQCGVFFNNNGEELDSPFVPLNNTELTDSPCYFVQEGTIFFTEEEDGSSKTWKVIKSFSSHTLCQELFLDSSSVNSNS